MLKVIVWAKMLDNKLLIENFFWNFAFGVLTLKSKIEYGGHFENVIFLKFTFKISLLTSKSSRNTSDPRLIPVDRNLKLFFFNFSNTNRIAF